MMSAATNSQAEPAWNEQFFGAGRDCHDTPVRLGSRYSTKVLWEDRTGQKVIFCNTKLVYVMTSSVPNCGSFLCQRSVLPCSVVVPCDPWEAPNVWNLHTAAHLQTVRTVVSRLRGTTDGS